MSPFTRAFPSYFLLRVALFKVTAALPISSFPSIAFDTIYFPVPSVIPTVPFANAAGYSPAFVPVAPTVMPAKLTPSGTPV